MTTICIIGGSGMLGSSLAPYLRNLNYQVYCLGRQSSDKVNIVVDFSDYKSIATALDSCNPNFIINLAAMTNVDLCESNPHLAYVANARVVESLSEWIRDNDRCHLIQISTDQIYDGLGPHSEKNIKIVNYYGITKYAGELSASSVSSTILRTNFFGKSKCSSRNSFSDWIFNSLLKEDCISVFDDVYFSPLSLASVVKYIRLVIENPLLGTFNLGSINGTSKANFAYTFAEVLGISTKNVSRVKFKNSSTKVQRPSDMRMNCSKFEQFFNQVKLPTLKDEILSIKGDYQNEI